MNEPDKELPSLTDEQIDAIANGMPGGLKGFTGGWGWRQFARAIEDALTPRREALGLEVDAARYRWLREWPGSRTDYITTGLPWAVHIEKEHDVPTMTALYGHRLDGAIDAALREHEKRSGVVEEKA